jgi:PKD repeat protein
VQNAVTGWHGIAQTDIRITGPSTVASVQDARITGVAADGDIQIILDAPASQDGGVAWNTPFGCSGGVLGLGGPSGNSHSGGFRGDSPYFASQDGTVSMRRSGCTTGTYPGKIFKTAVMHEIGHCLGLGHPDQFTSIHSSTPSSSWLSAVMASSVPSTRPSTPQADDIQGMQYLYGTAAVGAAPGANFSFSPSSPVAGAAVSFTDSSTNAPTGYAWDFGDSSPISHDRNPSHTFASAGNHIVKLYAGNANGTGTITKTVAVGSGGGGPSTCKADDTTLCLSASRFKVTAIYRTGDGRTGPAHAFPLTPNTGYFWFFDSTNVEVVTKVLPFCANPFNSIWIFAAGLTNVEVTLTYTDTKNGTVVTKKNNLNTAFAPVQDTAAFKTCP